LENTKNGDKKRILVVDDEEVVGVGMSEILKDAGFDAAYVTSGREALETMEDDGYSLIFMDMVMPFMNGLETYRKIKHISPGSRVVLFTGYFKDADNVIYQGVREGMIDEYIRKPFYAEEIVSIAMKYA
jgi:CheY-like chemotaxis protein